MIGWCEYPALVLSVRLPIEKRIDSSRWSDTSANTSLYGELNRPRGRREDIKGDRREEREKGKVYSLTIQFMRESRVEEEINMNIEG